MITGEMEFLLSRDPEDDSYDNFLGFGKKAKARRQVKRAERKASGQKTKVGQGIASLLGSGNLGSTIDNITGLFKKKEEAPSDYEVSMGQGVHNADPDEPKKKDNTMLIVGGVIVVGIVALGYTQFRKSQQLKLQQPVI